MKKYLIILFAVVMLLLAACLPVQQGSDATQAPTQTTMPTPTPTTHPTETTLPEETTVASEKDILTEQQRQEISAAWYEKEGCDLGVWYGFPDEFGMYNKYRVRCYGIWRDYIILLHLPEQYIDSPETITIADSVFQYRHPFDLIAYKDGEFYELEDLYEGGMLTKQDIAEIAKKHEG